MKYLLCVEIFCTYDESGLLVGQLKSLRISRLEFIQQPDPFHFYQDFQKGFFFLMFPFLWLL